MNTEEYFKASHLEQDGNTKEGLALIEKLAVNGDPLALLDMSNRYYTTEGFAFPVEPIRQDLQKSEAYALKAKDILQKLSDEGDGEAMRMLANLYLGYWHPIHDKSVEKAESWFLKSIEAGCIFTANELATFYTESDIEKAKYYYKMAEDNNCRVVQDERLEAALSGE